MGWVVISGHARGVDITAHRVALENGGPTIIVLPQGISDFKLRRELRNLATSKNILIISEFPPQSRWNVGYAMKRNKTIIGLSDAMILIEARESGGTFEAGKQALKPHIPLFVAEYETPGEEAVGNKYFLQRRANRILKNPETNRARLAGVKAAIEHRQSRLATKENDLPLQKHLEQLRLSHG